jgi:hypothetical protein
MQLMPSVVFKNSIRLRSAVMIAAHAFPAAAARQEETVTFESMDDAALPPEQLPVVLPDVRVTVVGAAVTAATLERALGPSLRDTYILRFSSVARFDKRDLFRGDGVPSASIHVWVDTTTPGSASLYFANGQGTRFLLRTLEISIPPDEMDREALAQAIEWSLQALAEGSAGLTRAQAEALLVENPLPASEAEAKETEIQPKLNAPWRRRTGWLPEVAFLHQWAPHSVEFLTTQGPLIRLGVDHLTSRGQIGFALSGQYQYPVRHAEGGVAINIETVASRFDVRYLWWRLIDGSGLGPRIGIGLDTAFYSYEALD